MSDKKKFPNHIAIIMDGNGRWARRRGLARVAGHQIGLKRVKEIIKASAELKLKALTLFAFSTENWDRPKREIDMLMRAFSNFLDKEINEIHANNIRLRIIGRRDHSSRQLLDKIAATENLTADNTGMKLCLAVNYGGRSEIVDAAKRIVACVKRHEFNIQRLNEKTFSEFLYAPEVPDPDLLIRTSGELRVSNFLIWQLAYAEFYFVKKFWPDFTRQELIKAIQEYQARERRFGSL